jgi:hypothetical protein
VSDESGNVEGCNVPAGVITVRVLDECRDDVVVNGVRRGGGWGVTWDITWGARW